ncbi:hypothetical protein [Vibrio casei]|uniref:hypothetical protein n=1 Tax=Vibrio casei TaxID=673372 RepID=UPI003F9C3015
MDDDKVNKIYDKMGDMSSRLSGVEHTSTILMQQLTKQSELLEKMAAQQEINASIGRRIGNAEKDISEIKKEIAENKVNSKINTAKISAAMTFITAIVMIAMKDFFNR